MSSKTQTLKGKIRSLNQWFVNFFKTEFGTVLLIVLGWQIVMTAFGIMIDTSMDMFKNTAWGYDTGFLAHMNHWDAGWYQWVAGSFYDLTSSPASPAFYPLFPILAAGVHSIFFGTVTLLASGLIVNTIALWLGLTALVKIIRHFSTNKRLPWIGVALFLTSPAAFFLHMFYGEAVFIAFGFWAYLFALQKKWGWMSLLLTIALTARLPAVTFILLCGLEYLRSYKWSIPKALNKNILWFFLTPLGFVTYGLYLQIVRGDFLAMFHAYHATNDWTYYRFDPNIIHTIGKTAKETAKSFLSGSFDYLTIVNGVLPLIGLALLVLASLYAIFVIKGRGIPLGAFGFMSLIMFTINSNTVSTHRYLLPCIVLFIAGVVAYDRLKKWRFSLYPVIYIGLGLQMYLMTLFICGYFAG